MRIGIASRNAGLILGEFLSARSLWAKVILVCVGAYLTAVSAQVVVWSGPVPFTMQVFMVMLIAGLYRPSLACASQSVYVFAGACGVPWYAGGGAFRGITFGYLLGFIVAVILISTLLRRDWFRVRLAGVILAMVAGLAVIYLLGAVHVGWVLGTSLTDTLAVSVVPFVIFDLMKIAAAGSIVYGVRRYVRT